VSEQAEAVVAAVVLAAGSSRRMGRDKLYLELAGETLLRRSVRHVVEAGLDPILVVTGLHPERVRRELAGLPVTAVPNPDHAAGQSTSLRVGLERVPAEAAAALVVLVDMPFVTPGMLREVVRRYRRERPPLVVSRYGKVAAPPTLYDRSLFHELAGGEGGKRVVERHLHEAAVLDWPEESLADIDVEEDYRRARARLEA
jgi:molybdenum cofactor cytidylyltransferase